MSNDPLQELEPCQMCYGKKVFKGHPCWSCDATGRALPESTRLVLAEDNGRIKERLRVLDVIDSYREHHPDDAQVIGYLREAIVND